MKVWEKIKVFLFNNHNFLKSLSINIVLMVIFLHFGKVYEISNWLYLLVVLLIIVYLINCLIEGIFHKKSIIEKLIAHFICVWIAATIMNCAILSIGSGVTIVILSTMFFKIIIKKWWSFSLYYLFSLIISGYLTMVALVPVLENKKMDDSTLGIIMLVLTIVMILFIVITEKDSEVLRELKVGTYFCIAVIASITAGSFIVEEIIATEFSDFIKKDINKELDLDSIEIDEEKVLKIKNFVSRYEDMNEISINSAFNSTNDPYLMLYMLYEYLEDMANNFTSKSINFILFPYLIMGVWCTFFIEYKERNIKKE